jgi:uncharacterized membrane protein YfcA
MLESFPVALLVGVLLGHLAGLGVGGGSLLILWLTLVLGVPGANARLINLMFFITAAGSVSLFRWRQGTLQLKKILPAIIAGSIAAGIFSWIGTRLDAGLLKKIFGILLLFTGVRELLYRPRNCK